MRDSQKKALSNIFRDLTKLTVVALVLGQFVPGQKFDLMVFIGGLITAILFGLIAILASVDENKGEAYAD